MNILRVIASMDPVNGGPCQGIRNSIPAQEQFGVQNEVVCFDPAGSDFLKSDPFKVHALGPARSPYAYCPALRTWLKENIQRFDVIIIHGVWLYNSFGTFSFWSEYKKNNIKFPRIFLMPHGMLDPYFQKAKGRRFKALRNVIFWQLFEKKVVNGINGLLFTCEEELLLARESFKAYRPKAELNIGYGIQEPPGYRQDFQAAFMEKCPEITGRSYLLFLSRIHPKKGVDLLIQAYLKLKFVQHRLPDLVIAGPGLETSYGRSLRSLAEDAAIHFTGMLEGEAKWGAFYGCEAFMLPSHQENFGIAVVEAMACKKPVLVSNQVNIWREIEEGEGGICCDDTEEGIYKMLKKWALLTPEKKREMGEKAAVIFQSHYTTERAAFRMIKSFGEFPQTV